MQHYLIINSGSSSVKILAIPTTNLADNTQTIFAQIDFDTENRSCKSLKTNTETIKLHPDNDDIVIIKDWLLQNSINVKAVGHRIVHGGDKYNSIQKIDDSVLFNIRKMQSLAPLHQHHSAAYIEKIPQILSSISSNSSTEILQYAYFDTAFHSTIPEAAKIIPLPHRFKNDKLMRYGFHGIAYESVINTLTNHNINANRIVAAHLGNGASMCAIKNGKSIDTTMSFTPLDGLMMGTRSGSIDPGIIMHLMQKYNFSVKEIESILYKQSGLLGISNYSNDMRELLNKTDHPQSQLAIQAFCHSAKKHLFSMIASLEGVDAVTFSGGIGENSNIITNNIAESLSCFGIELLREPEHLSDTVKILTSAQSSIKAFAVKISEETVIAQAIDRSIQAE